VKKLRSTFILPIFLLAYLCGSMGIFTSGFLDYHRNGFQELVRESPAGVEKLVFTPSTFQLIQWEKEGEEFEWQGKMYDVSKIEKTKNAITIECVHDDLEDAILSFLDVKGQQSASTRAKGKIQPLYFQGLLEYNFLRPASRSLSGPPDHSSKDPKSPEIPSPPPRLTISYFA
jgi:hypothetical protein